MYNTLSPGFEGRCTAPLLIDKLSGTAVSNESGDILKMLNAVDGMGADDGTDSVVELRPPDLVVEIDRAADWLYQGLNNGVYVGWECVGRAGGKALTRPTPGTGAGSRPSR